MKTTSLILAGFTLLIASCEKDPTPVTLNIPNEYDSTSFLTDASDALYLRSQMNQLVTEIKKGRTPSNTLGLQTLNDLFNGGNLSLKDHTHTYYRSLLDGSTGWLSELSKASGNLYTPGAPVGEGGVFGGYLFDENGLEPEQMIEKGLFGALNYYQATMALSNPSLANLNKALAFWGAHPSFPNTPTASKTTFPDVQMANYAARRSDINDLNSLYIRIKKSFIKAQAAIKAGKDFDADKNAAITEIQKNWEKVNAGTVINYCHSIISTMSQTETTDAQKASALHAYGECVGFLYGWRQLPSNNKIIADSEIDELLTLLLANPARTPESYKFITEPSVQLPKLIQVINQIQSIYGFSAAEIENFKNNYVNLQSR